ncbi:DUF397 domain-containing protein [Kitasatospora sp. NPDC093102]|uniref:DUF397 domain-containing protein n=1 Tax=Kitasatospora sp. NPDC093102 TaxID=3155069 RepID=UPI003444749D
MESSHSDAQANGCAGTEFTVNSGMAVRDSKDTNGPALAFSPDARTAFITALKAGELPDA